MSTTEKTQVRTRFAPSPTGFVHVGSLRTALFAFLFARHHGGVNVLRIEDTDQTRKVSGAIKSLLSSMSQLGIEFDEGMQIKDGEMVEVGGYGPYVQSNRLDIYHSYVEELIASKKAYYCFCSPQRLDELRKEQTAFKKPPMYDGRCRSLSADEVAANKTELEKNNQQPVVRQAIDHNGKTIVNDLVYGKIEYDNSILDDQILLKSDGFPTYHLAVVVDDHLMKITHVIRGDEWIPSTPKHILLFEAFGWEVPKYSHLPLILNPDKSKLSKRQGDVALEDFLSKGYLPEAMVNFIALLGWNPKTEQELFTMTELIEQFDLAKVNKAGAVFDLTKLDWMNGMYIRKKSPAELLPLLEPYLTEAGYDLSEHDQKFLEDITIIEQERLKKLSDITDQVDFYFHEPNDYAADQLVWKKSDQEQTQKVLDGLVEFFESAKDDSLTDKDTFSETLKTWIKDSGYDNGTVLWPLRVALTGLERSPGPFELSVLFAKHFGKQAVIQRLQSALAKLS